MKNKFLNNQINSIFFLEKQININGFYFNRENIWPVIRIFQLLARDKTNKNISISLFSKIRFIVLGIGEYIKLKCNIWPKSNNVFLSSAHYKVVENGITYDRILDPVLKWLESEKQDFIVLDFSKNFRYPKTVNYRKQRIKIQPIIYFLSFVWKVQYYFFSPEKYLQGNFEELKTAVRNNNKNFNLKSFYKRFFLLWKLSVLFEKLLRKMEVKRVGVVCYYDFKSLALVWAANRLNIPCIDFQHGVQGPNHPAYGNWDKSITKNSVYIPSHFWVWDHFSYKNLATWKDESGVILGSNKWMQDRVNFKDSEIILYTCQPLENPFPDEFLALINNYKGSKKWYIRLHPHQVDQIDEFELLFKRLDLIHKVNLKDATALPLTDLLARTSLHITKTSSVVIEASYFNIPTLFVDDLGFEMYKDQVNEDFLFQLKEGFVLREFLESISKNTSFYIRNNKTTNRFENIQLFYS